MIAHIITLKKTNIRGLLAFGDTALPCALGRAGIVAVKREGDGATPAGILPLRRVFYRPDRIYRPQTSLTCHPLAQNLGWCDDPTSGAYNQLVHLPFPAHHERLWREDHLYDVLVELGYNDRPAVPHHGSAIFLHICKDNFAPTEGCIALRYTDMLRLLTQVQPGDGIRVPL